MGRAFLEYGVQTGNDPPPGSMQALWIPTLKLPSLEGRSDVNVWSSPSGFFGKKEQHSEWWLRRQTCIPFSHGLWRSPQMEKSEMEGDGCPPGWLNSWRGSLSHFLNEDPAERPRRQLSFYLPVHWFTKNF